MMNSVPVSRRHTFWASGSLRCVLITTKRPPSSAVHLFDGDSPACLEPCDNADEAAVLAERMWQLFVETSPDRPA